MLQLTNIQEAGIAKKLNSPSEIKFYETLLNLIDEDKKGGIIDPNEDASYILEFKVFWLLGILVFKNERAKEYLFENLDFLNFIKKKTTIFFEVTKSLIEQSKAKVPISDQKILVIVKDISKFYELVYFLLIKDTEKIRLIKQKCGVFRELLEEVDLNRQYLGLAKEYDVFNWVKKLYKDLEDIEKN